ncbi:MAG: hypothetical protein Q8P58_01425 [Candidatus Adlerbacteria bacterium]|nr:hypothetical protein [Candidatus Adlerbacteria bacterium]MDZ4226457.1 hypothetical protein [Patescibacteria group bacterium]
MADDKKPESPYEIVWFVGGILAVLIALWWVQGGPERADLRGIFLAPPPPIGTGDAYGPQIGTSTYQQNQ